VHYSVFGATHVGKVRDHNEDSFFVSENGNFFLVSDGMGGLAAGELASKITRDTISEFFSDQLEKTDSVEKTIRMAFEKANAKVRKAMPEVSAAKGMGCTCVALVFKENDFFIGYVGDSRIYLYRKSLLKQITRDHSYVEELFMRGLITAEEKKDHPYKSSITRYVGHADSIEVDISSGPVANDDVFVLCSDGLTGEVEDDQIQAVCAENLTMEASVGKLVNLALENGGRDNITVVSVKVEKKKPGFFRKLFSW